MSKIRSFIKMKNGFSKKDIEKVKECSYSIPKMYEAYKDNMSIFINIFSRFNNPDDTDFDSYFLDFAQSVNRSEFSEEENQIFQLCIDIVQKRFDRQEVESINEIEDKIKAYLKKKFTNAESSFGISVCAAAAGYAVIKDKIYRDLMLLAFYAASSRQQPRCEFVTLPLIQKIHKKFLTWVDSEYKNKKK